jgi:two-component sensor histidine kinase/type II secretory pathway pseudopilin PulG
MAKREKSYIRQIILSFLGLSMISILVMAVTFFMVDGIYRQRIDQEITSFTQIITQNVDNFFLAPEDYLLSIRDHIDERLDWQEDPSEDYFIQDVIKLIPDFEEILLLGPEGRVLKAWPPTSQSQGLDLSNQEYFYRPANTGEVIWSSTFISYQTGFPTVALAVEGQRGRVVAKYSLSGLARFVHVELTSQSDFITILDAQGNVVAHTSKELALQSVNLNNLQSVQRARAGEFGSTWEEYQGSLGIATIFETGNSGFYTLVFKSYQRIADNLLSVYLISFLLLMFILIVYGALLTVLINRSSRPLSELKEKIALVTEGHYEVKVVSGYKEFEDLVVSFRSMVDQIQSRENELKEGVKIKETLIRELNHRTKNNMQVIIAMMGLYNSQEMDPHSEELYQKIQSKIEAISMVHEKLYQSSDLSRIDFRDYLMDLIPAIIQSLSNQPEKILYDLDIGEVPLIIDIAVPLGLVINEFTINSLKYAFPEGGGGTIALQAQLLPENNLELIYRDDGQGIPQENIPAEGSSIGLLLVRNIIENQLEGKMIIENQEGFYCRILIDLNLYQAVI